MKRTLRPVVVAVCFLPALPLHAADYVVTRYDDPAPGSCAVGDCSLREAIKATNANSNADRILLSAGTYLLTIAGTGEDLNATGDLDLTQEVEIVGPGATMTTVNSNSVDRAFDVYTTGTGATIRGVTIRGGSLPASGTAISVGSTARLTVVECEVRNNNGTGHAISVGASGLITMSRSLVTANVGSGVSVSSNAGAVLDNVTLTDNASDLRVNGNGGYAICNHCTMQDDVFALYVNSFMGGTATIANSIFQGGCAVDNGGSTISLGGNIDSGTSCLLDDPDDQSNVSSGDLALGSLGDNGGPTRTLQPGASSFAVDTANDAECQSLDQRGAARPGSDCDAGSVELEATRPSTPIFSDGFLQGDPEAWSATVG